MTKTEINATVEKYIELYHIAYKAWQETGSDACKQEAKYYWDTASKAIDKAMDCQA